MPLRASKPCRQMAQHRISEDLSVPFIPAPTYINNRQLQAERTNSQVWVDLALQRVQVLVVASLSNSSSLHLASAWSRPLMVVLRHKQALAYQCDQVLLEPLKVCQQVEESLARQVHQKVSREEVKWVHTTKQALNNCQAKAFNNNTYRKQPTLVTWELTWLAQGKQLV